MNIIVIGGTSGIGREVARLYAQKGNTVGITGRRAECLENMKVTFSPGTVHTAVMDVREDGAERILLELAEEMGGVDICLYSAGFGRYNASLDTEICVNEVRTNAEGFVRCATTMFNYWCGRSGKGSFATISSVAGIRPLGISSGYSASKKFQSFYLEAMRQLAVTRKADISFTAIKPGFVDTDFIAGHSYPFVFDKEKAARLIIGAIAKRKRVCVIDFRWWMITRLMYLIPGGMWRGIGRFFPVVKG